MELTGKTVVIGVSAGIAAYKTCYLVSRLTQAGAEVHVIMTPNAKHFVDPLTYETLSGNKCITDTFDRDFEFDVKHVSLAKKADLFMVAPASADVIAKMAHGICDDMLTTTFLAARCPKYVVPAMNTGMYLNLITQDNLKTLRHYGVNIIEPAEGHLACGDVGAGKMPEPEELYKVIEHVLGKEQDMAGLSMLVTAGATQEAMDPVRFITNHSTGKMGAAIAREAEARGAKVTYIKASTSVPDPDGCEVVSAVSAADLCREVTERAEAADIVIMAAAVADYRPKSVSSDKIKKKDGELTLELERTTDILAELGKRRAEGKLKPGQFICGFSMETKDLIENSKAKLEKKNCDMIVANNLKEQGAGFGHDTNKVTIITKSGAEELDLMSKQDVAGAILDRIVELSFKKA